MPKKTLLLLTGLALILTIFAACQQTPTVQPTPAPSATPRPTSTPGTSAACNTLHACAR